MIALVGGTGRLGRRLTALLLERGVPVRVVCRDPAAMPPPLRDRVELVRADVVAESSASKVSEPLSNPPIA